LKLIFVNKSVLILLKICYQNQLILLYAYVSNIGEIYHIFNKINTFVNIININDLLNNGE
jgi:hypothetical protein